MNFSHPLLDDVGSPILITLFIFLFILESKYELRKRIQSRWKRIRINVAIAFISFLFLRLLFIPVVVWIASKNQDWKIGLNHLLELPVWVEFAIGFLLLDYTNYVWHVINHKIPFLWRFHQVHHSDLDLDLTTATRFHFGELITSVVFRGAATLLIGATPELVLVYEIIFEAATNFHHSNWKLPLKTEKALNLFIVTPRMHGIHHSIVKKETDSNFSVIFSFWDRISNSLKLNIPQEELIIGVPYFRDPNELNVTKLITMPLKKTPAWQLPHGETPERHNQ
ncbi:sterol desaturase family protein [Rubrolithibacter danxiaensis]|uniref:sterol desaturase family protein n=1 Tax=Rubrolithibacter danxiaensis TaxID=3390805 RepID=UPI003BF82A3F